MLGNRKTLPLWSRRRPNLLAQERALANAGRAGERHTDSEHAVMEQKAAQRRFEEAKGKVRPAA